MSLKGLPAGSVRVSNIDEMAVSVDYTAARGGGGGGGGRNSGGPEV